MSDYEEDSEYQYDSGNENENDDYEYTYEQEDSNNNDEIYDLNVKYSTKFNGIFFEKRLNGICIEINCLEFFNTDKYTLNSIKRILYPVVHIIYEKNKFVKCYFRDYSYNNVIMNFFTMYLSNNFTQENNDFEEFLLGQFIGAYENLTNKCFICGDMLDIKKVKASICNKTFCKFSLENDDYFLDNDIRFNKNILNFYFELYKNTLLNSKTISNIEEEEFKFHYSPVFIDFLENLGNDTPELRRTYLIDYIKDTNSINEENYTIPVINKLLKWMVSNIESIIYSIEDKDKINEIKSNQYLISSSNLDKESYFQFLKRKYGSFFVFHGSNINNWYSIIFSGLKILSGTKYMSNGAVYGTGIYCANNLSVAQGYSNGSKNIVAICEVINNPEFFNFFEKSFLDGIFVVIKEQAIIPRYILEFSGKSGISSLDIRKLKGLDHKVSIENFYKTVENILDKCPICLMDFEKEETIVQGSKCKDGHYFHEDCFNNMLENTSRCAICGVFYFEIYGNQPPGTMSVSRENFPLPGFPNIDTYKLTFDMNDKKFSRIVTAYLPIIPKGTKVLYLLKKAFENKILFRIGVSNTTNQEGIVFTGIHLKTEVSGPYGYPDENYLDRTIEALAANGIISSFGRNSKKRNSKRKNKRKVSKKKLSKRKNK